MSVTAEQLYSFFFHGGGKDVDYDAYHDAVIETSDDEGMVPPLSREEYNYLTECDLVNVLTSNEMSYDHPGGDDIIDYVNEALKAANKHYDVVTWYGPNSEALIVGFRSSQLKVTSGNVNGRGEEEEDA